MTTEELTVRRAEPGDIDAFMALYDHAIEFQAKAGGIPWLPIQRDRVVGEIEAGGQWKIMEGEEIACIFLLTESDPLIWGEREKGDAIYVHRIVTAEGFHGRGYVPKLLRWSSAHARGKGKRYLRIDTWASNTKLVDYYMSCGF